VNLSKTQRNNIHPKTRNEVAESLMKFTCSDANTESQLRYLPAALPECSAPAQTQCGTRPPNRYQPSGIHLHEAP
jgi:hypothetical protein